MEGVQVIEVNIMCMEEDKDVYIADYQGRTIKVDPLSTELVEMEDDFYGRLQLTGEWDEDCFMADGFKRLA